MSDYDFIIAGGGTAGCILANRLSADGKYRVLMLEAGHEARSPWIGIPAGFSKLLVDPDYNWRFSTEPRTTCTAAASPCRAARAWAAPR